MGVETALIASLVLSAGATVYSTIESKKARDEAKDEIDKKRNEAEAARKKAEDADKERRRRLHARGSQLPQTVLGGGFAGVKTGPQTNLPKLLGV